MRYPGRVLEIGARDADLTRDLQHRLNEAGCGPLRVDGNFGSLTQRAVKLFQARFCDVDGLPLGIDGRVDPITWAALFGLDSVATPSSSGRIDVATEALRVADEQIGTVEEADDDRGPHVQAYLDTIGAEPDQPWATAFVYWCFARAAANLGMHNPVVRTAGPLNHWRTAGRRLTHRVPRTRARDDPSLIRPGMIFVISTGGGSGHTGIVESTRGGRLVTIEGQTNDEKPTIARADRVVGVFRHTRRDIDSINLGFIDYGER